METSPPEPNLPSTSKLKLFANKSPSASAEISRMLMMKSGSFVRSSNFRREFRRETYCTATLRAGGSERSLLNEAPDSRSTTEDDSEFDSASSYKSGDERSLLDNWFFSWPVTLWEPGKSIPFGLLIRWTSAPSTNNESTTGASARIESRENLSSIFRHLRNGAASAPSPAIYTSSICSFGGEKLKLSSPNFTSRPVA